MCRKDAKRYLAFAALPMLIASAAIASETPEAPPADQGTKGADKAHDETMARYAREKARAEAAAAVSDARKAASEASAAAAASAFGGLAGYEGAEGKVTVKDGSESVLEATLLSSLALREVADRLGVRLCNVVAPVDQNGKPVACGLGRDISKAIADSPASTGAATRGRPADPCRETEGSAEPALTGDKRPIVIVPEASTGPIAAAAAFDVRAVGIERKICSALQEADRISARYAELRTELGGRAAAAAAEPDEMAGGSAAFAAAGSVINTVANLFRTDYNVYAVSVTTDENLFVRELARAVRATRIRNPIFAPTLFPIGQPSPDNPAMVRLAGLQRLLDRARSGTAKQTESSRFFERALANAGPRTAQVQEAKTAHDAAAERLEGAADEVDAFVAGLTSSEGDAAPAMSAVLQEANTAALLRRGGLLVLTKVHFIGGTSFTRQNFFTFLGGMPYHVSGGALASYVVQDGRTSEIYDSMAIPVSGGYVRPTELRRTLQSKAALR